MATAVGVLGIVMAIGGLVYMLMPKMALSVIKFFQTPLRIYLALAMRFLFGIFFIYASRYCRPENFSQEIVLGIGVLAVAMAILFGMLGADRVVAVINWFTNRPGILRSAGMFAVIFGGYLTYASGAF